MDVLVAILLGVVALIVGGVLCLLGFCLPSPTQYILSKKIINTKTGRPLSNNSFKFPLGDITASLQDFEKGEGARLKWVPEGACGWWALNFYDVQLTNAEWVRELLTTPDMKFQRSFNSFTILNRLLGTSLLAAQGGAWARMHKILYKAFSPANLDSFVPVFAKQARRLADVLDTAVSTCTTVDMLQAFNELTLDVIVETGFGDSTDQEDKDKVLKAFRYVMLETQNPLHDIPILRSLPFPSNLEVNRQFKNLFDTADKICAARRAEYESGALSATHEGKYMIDLLLDAKDSGEKLTDVELRDNIVMLMVAGSETTGTTLTWLLWHIMSQPSIREKVLREVDALDISWTHFNVCKFDKEMPFLTLVINETLRISPSISGIPERIFTEDSTLGDLRMPAGARVGVAQYVMHRNPDYWTEPDKFIPERFTDEGASQRTPYCYMPFGLGRRQCLGKTFALNEIRVVMALLLK